MNRATRLILLAATFAGSSLGFGDAVKADGYPPFYGYSDYFGGPQVYFTPDDTIGQVTKDVSVEHRLGTRTYFRGGPFYTYGANLTRPGFGRPERASHRRRTVLRRLN